MLLVGLIYFIDFASLGYFKRKRFTAKGYYYIYRFMGWITLARFYRPLYHNLIDQRFGRRLARFLPVFIIGSMFAVSLQIVKYQYFPFYMKDGTVWIDHYNYDDTSGTLQNQLGRVTINSKYPRQDYVEVFTPYRPHYQNKVLDRKFPDLNASQYPGIKFRGAVSIGQMYEPDTNYDSLLIAMESMFLLHLNDSLRAEVQPRFHFHVQRQQPGLLYMVPTHDLPTGEHAIRLDRQYMDGDSLAWQTGVNIYFYK